jgi:ubiquinone/menaquinone biosynthesis C-methylase UbiE
MPYQRFANQEYRNFFQTHLEIPALLRALPIPTGLRILEVGCGRGVALPRFAELCRPSRLAGIDIDPDLITFARDRVRRFGVDAELFVGDVRDLPFDDAEFDVVIDFGTCYHIDHPERALDEIGRVLRSGGYFIHESPLAQLMAHPFRTSGRALPWREAPGLLPDCFALLWGSRRKTDSLVPEARPARRQVHAHA